MLKQNVIYNEFVPSLGFGDPTKIMKTMTFQVTDACNLKCVYCYQGCKDNHYMSFETAKKMIDYIFEHKNDPDAYFNLETTSGIIIEFIGGEPFLAIDLISEIIDYFEYKFLENPEDPWLLNHMYAFSSNGTLYFDERVQKLLNKYSELISLGITVDGCKELHDQCRLYHNGRGSYDDAVAAAIHSLKLHNNNHTKITISPDNVNYVFEGIKNMIELGFIYVFINCVYEQGWKHEHAVILYEQMKLLSDWLVKNNLQDKVFIKLMNPTDFGEKFLFSTNKEYKKANWCGCADCMFALDYKGDLYPCIRFMESSLNGENEPLILGNIFDDLKRNELHEKNWKILKSICVENLYSDKDCQNCPIQSGCSWCSAYNYQHFKDINKKATYICDTHKARALGSLYFYKLCKDKENYDQIKITKELALSIISEDEWNKLQWEEV